MNWEDFVKELSARRYKSDLLKQFMDEYNDAVVEAAAETDEKVINKAHDVMYNTIKNAPVLVALSLEECWPEGNLGMYVNDIWDQYEKIVKKLYEYKKRNPPEQLRFPFVEPISKTYYHILNKELANTKTPLIYLGIDPSDTELSYKKIDKTYKRLEELKRDWTKASDEIEYESGKWYDDIWNITSKEWISNSFNGFNVDAKYLKGEVLKYIMERGDRFR